MRKFRVKMMFLFFIALTFTNSYGQSDTVVLKRTIIEGKGISNHICIGDHRKSIRKIFGKTDKCKVTIRRVRLDCWGDGSKAYNKTKIENKRYRNFYCYQDLDLKVGFAKRLVTSLYFSNNNYSTTKGASVGTDRQTILRIYGGDYDSPIVKYEKEGIAFTFDKDDKVEEIRIFEPY